MITEKQLKVITSQLDVLEELKEELDIIVGFLDSAISKGKSWITDSSSETYIAINQLLTKQTQECLRRCCKLISGTHAVNGRYNTSDLDNQNSESGSVYSTCSSFTDNCQRIEEQMKETNARLARYGEAIESIRVKQEDQVKQIELFSSINEETEHRNKVKFDGILKDIQDKFHKSNLQFNEFTKQIEETKRNTCVLKTQTESLINAQSESKKLVDSIPSHGVSIRQVQEKVQTNEAKLEKMLKTQELNDKDAKQKLDDRIKELSTGKDAVASLKCQAETALNGIKEHEQRLKELSASVEKVNIFETKVKGLERAVKVYTKKQASMEQETNTKIGNITKEIQPISDSFAGQKVDIEAVSLKVQDEKKRLNAVTVAVNKLNANVAEISKKLTTYTMSTNASVTGQAKKIEALQVKNKTLDKKIDEVSSKAEVLSKQLTEEDLTDEEIDGFEAFVDLDDLKFDMQREEILTCFTNVKMDPMDSFDIDSGIFQAQVPGFYLCSLVIGVESFVPHDLQFRLCMKDQSEVESVIATCHTRYQGKIVTAFGIKRLSADFQVFVKPTNYCKRMTLNGVSHFSCTLLNKV